MNKTFESGAKEGNLPLRQQIMDSSTQFTPLDTLFCLGEKLDVYELDVMNSMPGLVPVAHESSPPFVIDFFSPGVVAFCFGLPSSFK